MSDRVVDIVDTLINALQSNEAFNDYMNGPGHETALISSVANAAAVMVATASLAAEYATRNPAAFAEVAGSYALGATYVASLSNWLAAVDEHGVDSTEAHEALGSLALGLALGLTLLHVGVPIATVALIVSTLGIASYFDDLSGVDFLSTINMYTGQALTGVAPFLVNLIDPLVVDLDGDGIELSALSTSTVHFDFNVDGFAERTGWASADDGMLVFDRNMNGVVDDAGELFGSPNQDGFAVLEVFDSNADGNIDASDAAFDKIKVWRDLDQDGHSDAGEVATLSQFGILSISLARSDVAEDNAGHTVGYQSEVEMDGGTTRVIQSIYFQTDGRDTRHDPTPEFEAAQGVELLPEIAGSGTIYSISYRASTDTQFRSDWANLTDNAATMSGIEFDQQFNEMMLRWAGVDDVNPQGRGEFVDARHLAFVEAFFGQPYREIRGDTEITTFPSSFEFGAQIESTYATITSIYKLSFLSQNAISVGSRSGDFLSGIGSPYFFYSLLQINEESETSSQVSNISFIMELIAKNAPNQAGAAAEYIVKGLLGLEGLIFVAYEDRASFAAEAEIGLDSIDDTDISKIAHAIVDGSAIVTPAGIELTIGTDADDVLIVGGGDFASGGGGSDLVVHTLSDGDLWLRDDGEDLADIDTLLLTDVEADDVSFARVGDTLLIKEDDSGATVTVENFFADWEESKNGVDLVKFADGETFDRDDIRARTVFEGDDGGNAISDSALDDVLRGGASNDIVHISGGKDTILYGTGDGDDVIQGAWNGDGNRDTLVLTDLDPDDVELSRNGVQLIIKIRTTGETIVDSRFFDQTSSMDAFLDFEVGIDVIKFANGVAWDRERIQKEAWLRGDEKANGIQGSNLSETLIGGGGDDVLSGGRGSDTYIWSRGDGNERVSDNAWQDDGSTDVLRLTDVDSDDVEISFHGDTLILTIDGTDEYIEVDYQFASVRNFLTDWNVERLGLEQIVFANGDIWDREEIAYKAGAEQFGRFIDDYTEYVDIEGRLTLVYSHIFDEFGQIVVTYERNHIFGYRLDNGYVDSRGNDDYDDFLGPGGDYGASVTLSGSGGDDWLSGGAKADFLRGDDGNDIVMGDGGNDVISGSKGKDELFGGDGLDRLDGGDDDDYLNGGDGKDYLWAGSGDNVLIGGRGDDNITGSYDSSGGDFFVYLSGDGDDVIYDGAGDDTLILDDLNADEVELSRSGSDLVIRDLTTNETIQFTDQFANSSPGERPAKGVGVDSIMFADGSVIDRLQIYEDAWIRGTGEDDLLIGDYWHGDTFDAGLGDDVIQTQWGGADDFIYRQGDGEDVIDDQQGAGATDTLSLVDLNRDDIELSRSGNDLLVRILSTDETIRIIREFYFHDDVPQGIGIDRIRFADGSEIDRHQIRQDAWFRGSDVRDVLVGDSRNGDIFDAGRGDDLIQTQWGGDDLFRYREGDGDDVIDDRGEGSDTLALMDLSSDEVTFSRDGRDLVVRIIVSGEAIRVVDQFYWDFDDLEQGTGIERIVFAGGTTVDRHAILTAVKTESPFMAGGAGNDTLVGAAPDQNLFGEDGNDVLDGGIGDDLLYGGRGNDILIVNESGAGDVDELDGGSGVDTADFSGLNSAISVDLVRFNAEGQTGDTASLPAGGLRTFATIARVENVTGTALGDFIGADASSNHLIGGAGADTLDARSGDDLLEGGSGDDGLIGGMGADTLSGGSGADDLSGGLDRDTFVISVDADADIIRDFSAGAGGDLLLIDRSIFVDLASAIDAAEQVGADVVIELGSAGTVTLKDTQLADLTTDNFSFMVLDNRAPTGLALSQASISEDASAGDVIGTLSTSDPDSLDTHVYSLVGADYDAFEIVGNQLRVKAGASFDYETTPQYVLVIRSTDENGSSTERELTIDVVDAFDQRVGTAGADTLNGDGGANEFTGAHGDDVLAGLDGGDTYFFNSGDGQDRINETGASGEKDVLVLGPSISENDIVVGRYSASSNDITLRIGHGADAIVLGNQLSGTVGAGIERIEFADGAFWTRAELVSRLQEALILGGAGDDSITGSSGADTFRDDSGSNTLSGFAGSDRYEVSLGDDTTTVVESANGGEDVLDVADLSIGDLLLRRSGDDLIVSGSQGAGSIVVKNQFGLTGSGVETLTLANGAVLGRADIEARAVTFGTSADDNLLGGSSADILQGGLGDDTIDGRAGSDAYVYFSGDGDDTIADSGDRVDETDSLILKDLAAEDVQLSRVGDDLEIVNLIGGGKVRVLSEFSAPTRGIETLVFANGVTWNQEQIRAAAWYRGTSGADTLQGSSANDTFYGGLGDDQFNSGAGSDTYVYGAGDGDDYVNDEAGSTTEIDVLKFSDLNAGDISLARSGVNLVVRISSTGGSITIDEQFYSKTANWGIERFEFSDGTHWDLASIISNAWIEGTTGADTLAGTSWADNLAGGLGDDLYVISEAQDRVRETTGAGLDTVLASVDFALGDHVENLTLTGSAAINATGNTLANVLTGNVGNNVLDGGAGADTMIGGGGDDTYVVSAMSDVVIEAASGGTDTVQSSVGYTLGSELENLTLIGSNSINGSGNAFANVLTGNAGANRLNGGAGADTMIGGAGDDLYIVGAAGDVVTEAAAGGLDTVESSVSFALADYVENLTLTGSAAINATGNTLANVLTGNSGSNVLDGGAGADTMIGGAGDDSYVVNAMSDVITETTGGGTDTVQSSVGYSLGSELENLTLTGSNSINGSGNALANVLVGNSGANRLNGGGGVDTMIGGAGDDTFVVNVVGDVVTESVGGGVDTVESSTTLTLIDHVENLTLTGSAAINATGNTLANVLRGNSGSNVLDGGTGVDTMIGGAGDDLYVADEAGDVVTEAAGGGLDTVQASVSFVLGDEIENLTLTGAGSTNATGNALANVLTGNGGNNVLDGGAGADTMIGGAGDDTYVVISMSDVVTESAGGGTDLVQSSVGYSLGSELENLTLTGSNSINGSGNALANVLTGNAGANRLNGAGGADTMIGGDGDDTYVVNVAGDVVTEAAGGGVDTVESSASFTLSGYVENLTLTGSAATNATGNALANVLTGNSGANVLDGGVGADTMTGGAGADIFSFSTVLEPTSIDHLVDYDVAADTISLNSSIFVGLSAGALSSVAFTTGAAASDADDRIIYNVETGALLFDRDGSGSVFAAVQFASISPGLSLTNAEFEIA